MLVLGLATLGLDFGCEAHLLGPVERGPCQAKNPLGRGFLDGTCMPLLKCKQTLRGIIRLNFPVICGIEVVRPIVCCPIMGPRGGGGGGGVQVGPFGPYGVNIPGVNSFDDYMRFLGLSPHGPNFGTIPGPYIPPIPHLPHGGTFGVPSFNPHGNLPGPTYPVPSQPLPPHSGTPPKQDNFPPVVSPPRPPHGNSPGTGPAPPQPGSGGPVVPPRPDNTPDKQPEVPAGGTDTPAEQGGPGAPCLDKPECEPGENDSYIHLIDPRQGKN